MPRPNDYPRWRYIAMQATMWGVLLCTVGIAALASNYKRGATLVTLGEPQLIDSISVRLPEGWAISEEGSNGFRATERADHFFRRVVVVRERDPARLSLLEKFMSDATTPASPSRRNARNQSVRLGPIESIIQIDRKDYGDGEVGSLRLTVKGVMPNQHEVTVVVGCYELDGRSLEQAMELLKLVAESVEYVPAKEISKEEK